MNQATTSLETTSVNALIFDLDGVIVDTAHYHFLAWGRLAEELGITFTETDNEQLKGVSRMRSLEILLSLDNREVPESEQLALASRKNGWYRENITKMTPSDYLDGVKSLLDTLKQAGMPMALASSSKNAPTILERIEGEHYFRAVTSGNDITHSKPHPEIFLKSAAAMGFEPKNCLVFEDAQAGVEAAKAAGMKVVGVGSAETLSEADFTVPGLHAVNQDWLREHFDIVLNTDA